MLKYIHLKELKIQWEENGLRKGDVSNKTIPYLLIYLFLDVRHGSTTGLEALDEVSSIFS